MLICTHSYDPSWDLIHLVTAFTPYNLLNGKQINLEITVQHGTYNFSALQLKDLKFPFALGWIPTNQRFIYLVSQRLVNLVHQPGESASVDGLGERIPRVGCLLQVQGTDELHAGQQNSSTEGLNFPSSLLILTATQRGILPGLSWHRCPHCTVIRLWDSCTDNQPPSTSETGTV